MVNLGAPGVLQFDFLRKQTAEQKYSLDFFLIFRLILAAIKICSIDFLSYYANFARDNKFLCLEYFMFSCFHVFMFYIQADVFDNDCLASNEGKVFHILYAMKCRYLVIKCILYTTS